MSPVFAICVFVICFLAILVAPETNKEATTILSLMSLRYQQHPWSVASGETGQPFYSRKLSLPSSFHLGFWGVIFANYLIQHEREKHNAELGSNELTPKTENTRVRHYCATEHLRSFHFDYQTLQTLSIRLLAATKHFTQQKLWKVIVFSVLSLKGYLADFCLSFLITRNGIE